jgi:retron-type reverse transcriptase
MPHKSEPSPSAQTAGAVKPLGPRLRVEASTVVLAHGVVMERHEGTPQGGSPSPLLANVLLDEADKELERRRHAFEPTTSTSTCGRSGRAGVGVAAQALWQAETSHQREQEQDDTRDGV